MVDAYRRLCLRVEALSATKHALVAMLLASVIDGSVFLAPPFAVLVPMVLAAPRQWWRLALYGSLASLAGGLIGFWLGTAFHGAAAALGIDLTMRVHRFGIDATVGQLLGDKFWVLAFLCLILPMPFKVVAIGSGLAQVPLAKFMLAAILGRTVRFFVVAGAMAFAGPSARRWLRV